MGIPTPRYIFEPHVGAKRIFRAIYHSGGWKIEPHDSHVVSGFTFERGETTSGETSTYNPALCSSMAVFGVKPRKLFAARDKYISGRDRIKSHSY
jgi:hypothetical protein